MDAPNRSEIDDRRKKKEQRRREVKQQRKQRLNEKSNQKSIQKGEGGIKDVSDQKVKEQKILKQREAANVESLSAETMAKLSFTEKLLLVKDLTRQIISYPAFSYNKLKELLTLCSDTSIDVVLKAVQSLC